MTEARLQRWYCLLLRKQIISALQQMEKLRSALKNIPLPFNKIYERRQTMRYARLSFFVFESSIFLFRKVKLWYTKVQKRQKQIIS